jgi:hypothetical protein
MTFQVERSANRGIALLSFGVAAVIFVLGLVVGIIVSASSSLSVALPVFSVLFVLSLLMFGFGMLQIKWRTLYPQTLRIVDGKIQWLHGDEVVGQVPLANVFGLKVLREVIRAREGSPGAYFAQKRHEEGKGLILRISNPDDKDTFWPETLWPQRFELQIDTMWEITYQAIHDTLLPLIPNQPRDISAPAANLIQPPTAPPRPAAEKNPFDFG